MNRKFFETIIFLQGRKRTPEFASCVILFFMASCNLINPAEPIPAYIRIDSVSLTTNSSTEGSNSSKIVDAWVYVDGNIIGTFELPVSIPVLSSGSHKLTVLPGILIDGIAGSRTNYPFYNGFDTTMNFEPGQVKPILPKTTYASPLNLKIEDFELSGRFLVTTTSSDTDLVVVQNEHSFEGKSGAAYLDNAHPFFECAWIDSFLMPLGSPAYVELNFKSENTITVGLTSYINNTVYKDDIVNFRPSQTWKKVYVSLGPVLSNGIGASGFKIYIKATKEINLATSSLYIDNIKVVYR